LFVGSSEARENKEGLRVFFIFLKNLQKVGLKN
jgi:hypothetical protein